jgi:hypothetical protein
MELESHLTARRDDLTSFGETAAQIAKIDIDFQGF